MAVIQPIESLQQRPSLIETDARIATQKNLSPDVYEVVSKSLK